MARRGINDSEASKGDNTCSKTLTRLYKGSGVELGFGVFILSGKDG